MAAVPELTHVPISLVTSLASVMEDKDRPAREARRTCTMPSKLEGTTIVFDPPDTFYYHSGGHPFPSFFVLAQFITYDIIVAFVYVRLFQLPGLQYATPMPLRIVLYSRGLHEYVEFSDCQLSELDMLLLLSLVHGMVASCSTQTAQMDDDAADATDQLRRKLFKLP
ncbi:hypothetical protein EV424DRAFT_1556707 [Suillus variegatus]|nr:hypothetical protein EV424DRAFT_1556707 [Suillus variegatus]